MGMMPLCIKTFFHALHSLVYSILYFSYSTTFTTREENDQAFSITL